MSEIEKLAGILLVSASVWGILCLNGMWLAPVPVLRHGRLSRETGHSGHISGISVMQ